MLHSDEAAKEIPDIYYKITAVLEVVNFLVILLFTKAWCGKRCVDYVFKVFSECAAKPREAMETIEGSDIRWARGLSL